ncbi:MAG: hypothetical protein ABI594_05100 [Ginsengibacter sp.]
MELNRTIHINNDSLVRDIQSEFSSWYPFLKIEFHAKKINLKSSRMPSLEPHFQLKQLAEILPGEIDINGHRTVEEVSNDIQGMLPVIVQMSRKSGNVWNTISISHGWTLQSQNTAGEFISSEMTIPIKP